MRDRAQLPRVLQGTCLFMLLVSTGGCVTPQAKLLQPSCQRVQHSDVLRALAFIVTVETRGMLGNQLVYEVSLYNGAAKPIKSTDGRYQNKAGAVAACKTLMVLESPCTFKDVQLSIPVEELQIRKGDWPVSAEFRLYDVAGECLAQESCPVLPEPTERAAAKRSAQAEPARVATATQPTPPVPRKDGPATKQSTAQPTKPRSVPPEQKPAPRKDRTTTPQSTTQPTKPRTVPPAQKPAPPKDRTTTPQSTTQPTKPRSVLPAQKLAPTKDRPTAPQPTTQPTPPALGTDRQRTTQPTTQPTGPRTVPPEQRPAPRDWPTRLGDRATSGGVTIPDVDVLARMDALAVGAEEWVKGLWFPFGISDRLIWARGRTDHAATTQPAVTPNTLTEDEPRARQDDLVADPQAKIDAESRLDRAHGSTSSTRPASTAPADTGRTPKRTRYVVQKGDTLTWIAQRLLGEAARWPEIYALNLDQLTSPDHLVEGMTLWLPDAGLPGEHE